MKFQLVKKLGQLFLIKITKARVTQIKLNFSVASNSCQFLAHVSIIFILYQQLPYPFPDFIGFDVFIDSGQSFKILQQFGRGFLANPLNPGNIIRRIAAQGLKINHLIGR